MQDLYSTIEINHRNIEYLWLGPPPEQSTTLVFLHEGLGSIAQWREFPLRLAEATACSALVYNRPSYGRSDATPLPWPITFMHDHALRELPALLTELNVQRMILVGHSDGASISLIYAGTTPHDRRLAGAAVLAPHVFVEEFGLASIREARDAFDNGDLRAGLHRYHGDNTDNVFNGWNSAWLSEEFMNWNIEEYLTHIKVPLLVVQGEDDQYGTLAQVDKICAGAGGPVERLILSDCRHSPHRDQSELLLKGLGEFAEQLID
jgi:pimeloyl-ACP methyl ester carboxylesterase